MTTVNDLLARARADQAIVNLGSDAEQGAEAYFQAYNHVTAYANPDLNTEELRDMAYEYLVMAATPPLEQTQLDAATLARRTLERLSA